MFRLRFKKCLLRFIAIILLAPFVLAVVYLILPPPSTLMLADLATLHLPHRTWLPYRDISPQLVSAVIASEDSAFCQHWGFDFRQMKNSLEDAADGKKLRGASTITQQTAKNLFLWNGRSWLRKGLEAPLSAWLELVMSKRRILEIYLNIVQWGDHVYGAEAAAHYHFGTSAKNLSLAQAALLAASLPNPEKRHAGRPGLGVLMGAANIAKRTLTQSPDVSCLQ